PRRRSQVGRLDRRRGHRIDPHRPGDVLDLLLAAILERIRQFVANLVAHHLGDADAGGLCQRLQASRHIDPVAVYVVILGDDIAKIDPDAKCEPTFFRNCGVTLGHFALHFDGATHRVDDTLEFDEEAVAGRLDDSAAVFPDARIGDLAAPDPQTGERRLLV